MISLSSTNEDQLIPIWKAARDPELDDAFLSFNLNGVLFVSFCFATFVNIYPSLSSVRIVEKKQIYSLFVIYICCSEFHTKNPRYLLPDFQLLF